MLILFLSAMLSGPPVEALPNRLTDAQYLAFARCAGLVSGAHDTDGPHDWVLADQGNLRDRVILDRAAWERREGWLAARREARWDDTRPPPARARLCQTLSARAGMNSVAANLSSHR